MLKVLANEILIEQWSKYVGLSITSEGDYAVRQGVISVQPYVCPYIHLCPTSMFVCMSENPPFCYPAGLKGASRASEGFKGPQRVTKGARRASKDKVSRP